MQDIAHHHHFWERHARAADSTTVRTPVDIVTISAFVGFVLLAGSAPVAIRATYAELAPFWSATLRFTCGAIAFWALMRWKNIPLPRGRALAGACIYGVLMFGGFFLFAYYGLKGVPAGLYQTLSAVVPLMTLVFAVLHGQEQWHLRGVGGALLAVAGIAVIFGGAQGALPPTDRLVAVFIAAACSSEVAVLAKKFPRTHIFASNAVGMTIGAAMLAVASLISGETWSLPVSTGVWLWFGYIVLLGTVLLFVLFLFVLSRWSASAVAYSTVLTPMVGIILAAIVAGESPSMGLVFGAPLVLAGVFVGTLLPH
jgi:drug/metabolite transporter (DMT)-like permease